MTLRDHRYPQREYVFKGQSFQFKDFFCEIPDDVAVQMLQSGEFEPVREAGSSGAVINDFSATRWKEDRKIFLDTALSQADGYGKAGTYLALGLKEVSDLYLLNNGYISDVTNADVKIIRALQRESTDMDAFYIQFWPAFNFTPIAKRQIGYTMLESTRIPQYWVDHIHRSCERIIVPCGMQKQAFIDSGVDIDVHVIPLGIDPDLYPEKSPVEREEFVFGVEGTLTYRKGVDQAVKAFQLAFPKNKYPNVALFIKTRRHGGFTFGKTSVKDGFIVVDGDERIKVIAEQWDHKQLIDDFYHFIDAYVFLSRGEGFGLTTIQAMSVGLPVIGTECGGIEDQLDDRWSYSVKTALVDVPNGYICDRGDVRLARTTKEYEKLGIGYPLDLQAPDQQWHDCDIGDAANQMKIVFENQVEARKRGKRAAKEVRKNWTHHKQAERIIQYLDQKL